MYTLKWLKRQSLCYIYFITKKWKKRYSISPSCFCISVVCFLCYTCYKHSNHCYYFCFKQQFIFQRNFLNLSYLPTHLLCLRLTVPLCRSIFPSDTTMSFILSNLLAFLAAQDGCCWILPGLVCVIMLLFHLHCLGYFTAFLFFAAFKNHLVCMVSEEKSEVILIFVSSVLQHVCLLGLLLRYSLYNLFSAVWLWCALM